MRMVLDVSARNSAMTIRPHIKDRFSALLSSVRSANCAIARAQHPSFQFCAFLPWKPSDIYPASSSVKIPKKGYWHENQFCLGKMLGVLRILVLCSSLHSILCITLSLESSDNVEEDLVTPKDEFGICQPSESIDLSHMKIGYIRDNIVNTAEIQSVYLNDNDIKQIPHFAFKDATKLLCLDFSRNKISVERLMDFGHKTVKALDLSYQRPEDRNGEWGDRLKKEETKLLHTTMFSNFPSLQYLDLSGNPIYNMPENFSAVVPALTHLYITNRHFKDLSDNFFQCMPQSLKSLHIENNNITIINFPDELSIEALFFDSNQLVPIGHHLRTPFLKYLSLSNCTLETLNPDGNRLPLRTASYELPGDVPNLEILDLSWNRLQNIDDVLSLTTYNHLKRLSLSHNQFKVFPVGATFTALEGLSMSYNQITMIPNAIHGFPSLKVLNLRGNKIQNIHVEAFTNMILLEALDLSQNHLESLPAKWLHPLTNLHHLDLRHNKFGSIPDMFGQLPLHYKLNLADLYLKSDALKTVDTRMLEYLPSSCVVHTC